MIKAILTNRLQEGPFRSLGDLIERLVPLSITKSQLEQLCYAGAIRVLDA